LNVPVVCSLQDEDVWVDVMKPSFRDHVWNLMSERANDVDAFIAVSDYYAKAAQKWMNLPEEKIHTVHLGVDPDDYPFYPSADKSREIGFISRMNNENGLDILIDAFILLKKEKKFDDVHLHITGGSTGEDANFIKEQKMKLEKLGIRQFAHFWEGFEMNHRKHFLKRVQLISVPVRIGEAFGIYLSEAMASGIPVVQPALGAFPEIINVGGGGVIYQPNTSETLAKTLMELFDDPKKIERLSIEARTSVENYFNINMQAEKLISVYEKLSR
jgi:glycosyltransferase involved in cell wall biosynthesis